MGQFSWIYSDTEKQIIDDKYKDSYLLVPREFHDKYGTEILEKCYDGYGHFGGYDVYELIAEWNKEFIPEVVRLIENGEWHCSLFIPIESLMAYYNDEPFDDEVRAIGIILACYDDDNARLKYPIKIVENKGKDYDEVKPSETDPDQGWNYHEDENPCSLWDEEEED